MVNINIMEINAREKAGLPDDFHFFQWACMPPEGPTIYVALTGAVTPLTTRGKRKGLPRWEKRDRKTTMTINVTIHEHELWKSAWERRTGKCSACVGKGTTFAGWTKADGVKYRECSKCNGTGKYDVPPDFAGGAAASGI